MDQGRLFKLAVESGSVTFVHEAGRGWRLTLCLRRGSALSSDFEREDYCCLTTVELLDTIAAHLDASL